MINAHNTQTTAPITNAAPPATNQYQAIPVDCGCPSFVGASVAFASGVGVSSADVPGCPAYLAFETWDVSEDELQPGYYSVGPLIVPESIQNGFRAATGDKKVQLPTRLKIEI